MASIVTELEKGSTQEQELVSILYNLATNLDKESPNERGVFIAKTDISIDDNDVFDTTILQKIVDFKNANDGFLFSIDSDHKELKPFKKFVKEANIDTCDISDKWVILLQSGVAIGDTSIIYSQITIFFNSEHIFD